MSSLPKHHFASVSFRNNGMIICARQERIAISLKIIRRARTLTKQSKVNSGLANYFSAGKNARYLGLQFRTCWMRQWKSFASVVRTAPYGKYTARAQFDIGLAREKQGQADAAITAYQAVIDKFPNEPVAADAQYQIGYLWYASARAGAKDPNAVSKATTGFQDFLFRYPHSEKAPQARENLARLGNKATSDSFGIAKFYEKRGNYRAAVIYFNDVIRQQPGSSQGDEAKRHIDQLALKDWRCRRKGNRSRR